MILSKQYASFLKNPKSLKVRFVKEIKKKLSLKIIMNIVTK